VIELVCLLAASFRLPLRQAEGFTRGLLRLGGIYAPVPDHTTLCRRRKEIGFRPPPQREGPLVIAIDSTGITLCSPGEWTRHKYGDQRRAKYVKLHCGVNVTTGELTCAIVTPSEGKGSGDKSQGPVLIEAARLLGPLAGVYGDGAYDARDCYRATADAGGRFYCPLPDNARYGGHPTRDLNLAQIGRIGPTKWNERIGYGDRAHIEGAFSALKRTTGYRSAARSLPGAIAEELIRVNLYNRWRAQELADVG
jgi:hypothetical protein